MTSTTVLQQYEDMTKLCDRIRSTILGATTVPPEDNNLAFSIALFTDSFDPNLSFEVQLRVNGETMPIKSHIPLMRLPSDKVRRVERIAEYILDHMSSTIRAMARTAVMAQVTEAVMRGETRGLLEG